MDFDSPAGTAARFLLGLTGVLLGLYLATAGFGDGALGVLQLPGARWLLGVAGFVMAAGSASLALTPPRRS